MNENKNSGLGDYLVAELYAQLRAQRLASDKLNQELKECVGKFKIESVEADESEDCSVPPADATPHVPQNYRFENKGDYPDYPGGFFYYL